MRYQPLLALLLAIALQASPAWARAHRDLPWASSQAWTSAVRLLRLDMGFEVTERDRDAGFILFRYSDGEHQHAASMEIIERLLPDGRTGVRVVITVAAMPTYVELHLIDRLQRKLREEVGEPLAAPRPRRAAASREADDDDDDDDDDEEDEAEEEDE